MGLSLHPPPTRGAPPSTLGAQLPHCLLTHHFFPQNDQAAAETAYDMVSPSTLSIEPKKAKRFPHHRLAHQPVDLREGVAKAYSVVKEVCRDLS